MSAEAITLGPLALLALPAFAAGYAAGMLHFRSLALVASRMVEGRLSAVALQLGRLAALGVFLWLCALAGPEVLIAAAAGLLLGRARVLREARR